MARRWPLVVGLAGLVALTVAVLVHPAPFGLDAAVHRWAVRERPALGAMRVVTRFGTVPWLLIPLAVSPWWRRPRRTVLVVAVAAAVLVARRVVADAVDRPRPPRADWLTSAAGGSFPSGHATTVAVAAAVGVLLARGSRTATVPWVLLAVAVGTSRVLLGVHWPTDVLAGWCVGLVVFGALRSGP